MKKKKVAIISVLVFLMCGITGSCGKESALEAFLYKYIENASKNKIVVQIPYTYENNVFAADYSSDEFVEAITGNMIESYQNLIQEMIQENTVED